MMTTTTLPPAGLFRRLAALFYDALIIIALEMMAATLYFLSCRCMDLLLSLFLDSSRPNAWNASMEDSST